MAMRNTRQPSRECNVAGLPWHTLFAIRLRTRNVAILGGPLYQLPR
jgi:hypothetical protein